MFWKGVYQFVIIYRVIFSMYPLTCGSISETTNIFWNILGSTDWLKSIRKNDTMNFCLFVYFRSYNKSKFSFLKTVLVSKPFLAPFFLALIFLHILNKIPWENYVRLWKFNLKRTPQSAQNSFLRKSNLKFCIIFNMIPFANYQCSVKIRLAYSKVLLLINYLMVI